MSTVIVLVGLPGCGKSDYAIKYVNRTSDVRQWKICSSDQVRKKLYGDERIQGNPSDVFNQLHREVNELLTKNINVVYDATNMNRKNRKQIIDIAKKHNATIEAHVVWCPYEDCITRDATRSRNVGSEVIKKMLYRFEMPFYNEGFPRIKIVHNESVDFDRVKYRSSLIESMNIPHDNPHHSLPVDKHCECAAKWLINNYNSPILVEAAFIHDCGKPLTKFFKRDEKGHKLPDAHYYNHDNVGAYLSIGCYDPDVATGIYVPWLISSHMQPFFNSTYYQSLAADEKEMIDKLHEADLIAH